jgi:hypothetical protein
LLLRVLASSHGLDVRWALDSVTEAAAQGVSSRAIFVDECAALMSLAHHIAAMELHMSGSEPLAEEATASVLQALQPGVHLHNGNALAPAAAAASSSSSSSRLTSLSLRNVLLDAACFALLLPLLSGLHHLRVEDSFLNAEQTGTLLAALATATAMADESADSTGAGGRLRSLRLRGNCDFDGAPSCASLLRVLHCNTGLRVLEVCGCDGLDDACVELLLPGLRIHPCLRFLRFQDNSFSNVSTRALLQLQETNPGLCVVVF